VSLLLRHLEANGPLSRADLEAATRRQQQAGGSLDTAILELGLMTPLALDALLQSACGLPGAPVRLLERGPTRPWEHVPRDLVDIGWAMPLAAEDGRLIVAVHPDLPDAKLGQLYRLIRGFYPVVAPECCLAKVAVERTGAILAPRYALILLDYLEALRSTTSTVHLPASDAPLQDVPVPADRQNAGPRPAAMSGPAVAARASTSPVSSDSSGASSAAAPVASDRAEAAHPPAAAAADDTARAPEPAADNSGATPVSADLAAPSASAPPASASPVPSDSSAEDRASHPTVAPGRSDSGAEAASDPASTAPGAPVLSGSTAVTSEPVSSDSASDVAPTAVASDVHDLGAASPAPGSSAALAEADRSAAPSPLAAEPVSDHQPVSEASTAVPSSPAPKDSPAAAASAAAASEPSGAQPARESIAREPEAPARSASVPSDRVEEAAPRGSTVSDALAPEPDRESVH
jgi:hypothetical protein